MSSQPSEDARIAASPLVAWLQQREREIVGTIREMVKRESPSSDKQAVDALGAWLAERFRAAGATVTMHPAVKYGDHLQADFPGEGERVLLLGHFDTVWDVGTLKTMPWREEKGRLWGPGVLDMKTGIAQMLFAVEALRAVRGHLPRPVTVLLVTDEEVGSGSSRRITERVAKDCAAVLVLEPSFGLHGALKTARKGVGAFIVTVIGVASHAGLDFEKGASAILELSRQLLKVAEFPDVEQGITVNPGVIRGGTRNNVIAAEASANIDVRITKLAQASEIEKKIRGLIAVDRRCKIMVEGGLNRPPLERTEAVARLFGIAKKAGAELGLSLDEAAVGGGSDGNFTAALEIPTLDGLGAPGEGAHAVNESVLVEQIVPRTALLARLIEEV
ncbi:MAG TPA: M20 family metallopeptidase [Terriglobales bacterium]|nr:M20 family metallopeptidase [Terriglobales bacterium]